MDYAFFATLAGLCLGILLTYDIACQYCKNISRRIPKLPSYIQPNTDTLNSMRFAIPKKHWAVHGPNHSQFSLNFLRHVGRTYGEGIESSWSHFNPVAGSTREMSPAVRQENLDDHFGDWNHMKILGLCNQMATSLETAWAMSVKHTEIFQEFSKTFPVAVVEKWGRGIEQWDEDLSLKPDPYEEMATGKPDLSNGARY